MQNAYERKREEIDDYKFVTSMVISPVVVVDDGVGLNVDDDDDICGVTVCWFFDWICCKFDLINGVDKFWFWWLIRVVDSKVITVAAVAVLESESCRGGFMWTNVWDLGDKIFFGGGGG